MYHLAYINGTINFYKYPGEVLDVGINGTLNLINQINKYGKNVKKFILPPLLKFIKIHLGYLHRGLNASSS